MPATASLHTTGPEAGRQQLHIQTSLHPAPVLGDPNLIERLAVNLLDNAVRHNTTTGGTIQLTTGQHDGLVGDSGQAGDLRGAAAYQEVIPDMVRVLGRDHPDTMTARANLAYWQGQMKLREE